MIDLHVKLAIAAVVAWAATRRIRPADAARAHRVWLVILISPALWVVGEGLFPALAVARLREGVWPAAAVSPADSTLAVLKSAYLTIAALLLARLAWGTVCVRRLLRDAKALDSSDLARLPDVGLAAAEIRVSDLSIPVTAGFIRPVILLPASWRTLPGSALEAILRHEAAHVRRRDCAIALGCAVMEALFWFNPAVWIASARARWFAEMACDSEAASGMSRHDYASELLTLAVAWRSARRPLAAVTAGADTSVARRIHLLLDEGNGRRHRILLPIVAACLLIGMPLAATIRVGGTAATSQGAPSHGDHAATHQFRHRH